MTSVNSELRMNSCQRKSVEKCPEVEDVPLKQPPAGNSWLVWVVRTGVGFLVAWMLVTMVDLVRFQSETVPSRWTKDQHIAYSDMISDKLDKKADKASVEKLQEKIGKIGEDVSAIRESVTWVKNELSR